MSIAQLEVGLSVMNAATQVVREYLPDCKVEGIVVPAGEFSSRGDWLHVQHIQLVITKGPDVLASVPIGIPAEVTPEWCVRVTASLEEAILPLFVPDIPWGFLQERIVAVSVERKGKLRLHVHKPDFKDNAWQSPCSYLQDGTVGNCLYHHRYSIARRPKETLTK